jgi:hypothetical protein
VTWDYRPDVEASSAACDRENAHRYLKDTVFPATPGAAPH